MLVSIGDYTKSKIPINGDFTVFGTAVTLQQIFVIHFRMNFELVLKMRGQKLFPHLFLFGLLTLSILVHYGNFKKNLQ